MCGCATLLFESLLSLAGCTAFKGTGLIPTGHTQASCRMPELLAFGEALLTYKPLSSGGPIQPVSTVVQACGGAELNAAAALAQLGRSAEWLSILPTGPLGEFIVETARGLGVDTKRVIRLESTVGTNHIVDDGSGPRPHFQRRHSAFCQQCDAATFDWPALLANVRWLHLTGITPQLGDGPRAAWSAALEAVGGSPPPTTEPPTTVDGQVAAVAGGSASMSAQQGPLVCLDLNHRPALGSLEALWRLVRPQLPRLSVLMLSEDTLQALAQHEGCWDEPAFAADVGTSTYGGGPSYGGPYGGDSGLDARFFAQRQALVKLQVLYAVPLLGCTFKRPVPCTHTFKRPVSEANAPRLANATGGGHGGGSGGGGGGGGVGGGGVGGGGVGGGGVGGGGGGGAGGGLRQKSVTYDGRIRRWSTVAFDGVHACMHVCMHVCMSIVASDGVASPSPTPSPSPSPSRIPPSPPHPPPLTLTQVASPRLRVSSWSTHPSRASAVATPG